MIFTTKAEYGVRLLIQLGLQGSNQPVSLKAVADAENLPLAYLERIAALLKKAGLVTSTRGAHGGYVLARPAEDITMDQVVLSLEGAIAPMDCFIDDRESRVLCSHLADGEHCATKLLSTRVQMGVIKSLQRTTLAELVEATRGAHGGYVLARAPEEITMDAVVLALEGAIAPMDCFLDDHNGRVQCSHHGEDGGGACATKLLWTRVQMGVIRSLQRTTLAELIEFDSKKPTPALPTPVTTL